MKVLFVSHEFPPIGGGGANACYYLAKGLCCWGHEVTVVTANYKGLQPREIIEDVEVIRVSAKRKYQEHCGFLEMLSYLIKAWPVVKGQEKLKKYDICLVFFGIPSGPIGYLLKKKYDIPYIIRFGGGDIPGFQERFDKVYKLIAPVIRVIWNHADRLVANSEGLRNLAYDFYDKKEIQIITNGVDTNFFMPRNEKHAGIELLFVSRLIERKGLQYFIPQMKDVIANCDTHIHLTVVGDGPYKPILEEMTWAEGIEEYVSFEGYKNRDEIREYYQKADLFLLPSKKEGMPNVVLEAMACGLPIVMTPCEGNAELIRGNGKVVPYSQFAKEIIKICNDAELRERMGKESRKQAVTRFSWDYIVDRYLALMEKGVNNT